MQTVSEHPANTGWLRWKATAVEWLSVIIACASTVIALISMFVTSIALGVIWAQEQRIDALETEVRIYSNRSIRLETWLKSKGLEEIYDD